MFVDNFNYILLFIIKAMVAHWFDLAPQAEVMCSNPGWHLWFSELMCEIKFEIHHELFSEDRPAYIYKAI